MSKFTGEPRLATANKYRIVSELVHSDTHPGQAVVSGKLVRKYRVERRVRWTWDSWENCGYNWSDYDTAAGYIHTLLKIASSRQIHELDEQKDIFNE
jgi:hypothetical protein